MHGRLGRRHLDADLLGHLRQRRSPRSGPPAATSSRRFGGYAADNGGTEIADSCTNVSSIAAAYESVITTYNVTRLDLDTEDNSLTNTAGIDRRNKAIKMVEDWAAANGRTVQFSYTLPTTTSGLAGSGLAVLQNAVSNNARIDVVNIMTFDYYDGATHNMANDTETAATGLEGQLASLYPGKSAAQLWGMVGVTEMPGIDDYGAAETFQTADARTGARAGPIPRASPRSRSGRCSVTTAAASAPAARTPARASHRAPGTSATPSSRSPAAAARLRRRRTTSP